jgi:hypothetical protein
MINLEELPPGRTAKTRIRQRILCLVHSPFDHPSTASILRFQAQEEDICKVRCSLDDLVTVFGVSRAGELQCGCIKRCGSDAMQLLDFTGYQNKSLSQEFMFYAAHSASDPQLGNFTPLNTAEQQCCVQVADTSIVSHLRHLERIFVLPDGTKRNLIRGISRYSQRTPDANIIRSQERVGCHLLP